MKVIKRNGQVVEFDKNKIINAITKAFIEVDGIKTPDSINISSSISDIIEKYCIKHNKTLNVEEIQDMVVHNLINGNRKDVGIKYIEYRYKRKLVRDNNTTDDTIMEIVDGTNEYWSSENSNKNPRLNTTIRDYMAGETSTDISRRILLPKDIIKAHDDGILHFHDMDYFIQKLHNCDLVNLEDMLQNGTVISEVLLEKPHSFSTACNIATQIIAQVASSQYGGQSISLAHLAPFVEVSRQKIRSEVIKEREDLGESIAKEKIDKIVESRLRKEINKGIQTIQYQVITLQTTNGQAPFLTVFMYLGEAKNEREKRDLALLIEEMLLQRKQGVKNELGVWVSPAFPKLIYVLEEENIHENSKYWYLTKLAAECSAKRLVPDYISEKIMKELKEGNCYPVMGCVDGSSKILYKHKGNTYFETFEKMWARLERYYPYYYQPGRRYDVYMDLENVEIYDSVKGFVNTLRLIKNYSKSWVKVIMEYGRELVCTIDHPFHTLNRGRVLAKDLKINQDEVMFSNYQFDKNFDMDIKKGKIMSVIPLDGKIDFSYDVTTESDHFDVNGIYSHNCRSALTVYKDDNNQYKFYGRFNQGVVTISLPDIALSSGGDFDKFWELFEERTELCHKALQYRHKRLEGTPSDVAPILWRYGALSRLKHGETIDKLLHGGYSTISLGYAGLYECVKYMTGHSHSDEGIGEEFGLKVMQALNDKCKQWKNEENIDYSIYGTPIESTTYKFAKCLRKRFGIIKGITDRNYITNSYHIPVFEQIDAFEKLRIEAKFQKLSPGGAISYIETPNVQDNIPALLEVIKYIYDNIMYAEINTKSDYCQVCGYDKEIKLIDENGKLIWECPNCGNRDTSKMDVARRTCGYIGTVKNGWNQGRLGDIHDRVTHLDNIEFEENSNEIC